MHKPPDELLSNNCTETPDELLGDHCMKFEAPGELTPGRLLYEM